MAFVNHMALDSVTRLEISAVMVFAKDTQASLVDLFAQVLQKTVQVLQVLDITDEKAVLESHVNQVFVNIVALFITEQADRLVFHSCDTDSGLLFLLADLNFSFLLRAAIV